jgi:hypothetical protein
MLELEALVDELFEEMLVPMLPLLLILTLLLLATDKLVGLLALLVLTTAPTPTQ